MARKQLSIGEIARNMKGARDARAFLSDSDYMQYSSDVTNKVTQEAGQKSIDDTATKAKKDQDEEDKKKKDSTYKTLAMKAYSK